MSRPLDAIYPEGGRVKPLRLAPQLSLPVDVAGEAIAILAKRGAGKSNTAKVLVEEVLDTGLVQVIVLDPVGHWWSLRAGADGKPRGGYEVAVFGGMNGDLPLEELAGKLLAQTAVDAAGGVRERPTGQALLNAWLQHQRMGEGERRVLLTLIDAYPDDLSHQELCERTGYSPVASTMGVILSKLRKLGLVEKGARRVAAEFYEAIAEGA